MNFVVIKFNELIKIIYLFLGINAILLGIIYGIDYAFELNLNIFRSIGTLIAISLIIIGFLLRTVTIKHRILTHIIGKPVIHGIWKGQLTSNFEVEGKPIPPIEIYFYIKQTFLITTIKSFTPYIASESIITALFHDEDSETTDFYYIYKFYRTKNNENKVTFGAGKLRLSNDSQTLEGNYWTTVHTCGDIELHLINSDCTSIDSYQMAQKYDI